MTTLLAVAGFIVALGPMRQADRLRSLSQPQTAVAAVAAAIAVGVLSLVAGQLLDWADVSGPTARIGAGLAVVATALVRLVRPALPLEDPPVLLGENLMSGLVPAAFPVLLQPVVGILAVAVAAERGAGIALASAVPALGLWIAAIAAGEHIRSYSTAVTRVVATFGFPVGVAMAVGGIFAV